MRGADKGKKREARTYFPTPQSRDFRTGNGDRLDNPNRSRNLNDFAEKYPTPTASMVTVQDMEQARFAGNGGRRPAYGEMLPTPAARDYRSPNSKPFSERGGGTKGEQLPNVIGGQLNPDWVEWLMGWPIGWTSLEPMDQAAFAEWKRQIVEGAWWLAEPDGILRVAKGVPHRVGRLKCIGNGQVPSCAVMALTELGRILHA